jgi:small-conductance mechanosensitive channel
MYFALTRWPDLDRLIWTAVTLAGALLVGFVINRLVVRQFQRVAARTTRKWDDAVSAELGKRVVFWFALVGVWLAIGYWPMTPRWTLLLTDAVEFIAILSIARAGSSVAVRVLADLAPHVSSQVQVSGLMRNVVRFTILTIGLLVAFRSVGVEITPMLAALGVGGLAAALALQEPLSNLFAGLFITIAGQLRIGDYIRIEGGPEGVIGDFRWNATQLQTLAGNVVIVPNAKLSQAMVTNLHRPTSDSGFSVEFVVEAAADLDMVERLGVDVAASVMREVAGGMPEVTPSVRFMGFSELGVRCAVNVRTQQFSDQALVRHELIKRVQAALRQAGIEIPTLAGTDGHRPKPDKVTGQRS